MKVFIIAMESEAKAVFENLTDLTKKTVNGKKIITGNLFDEKVGVVLCGVGKVNAAVGTQYAIDAMNADCIINLGVAGGLNDTMQISKIYSIESAVQYDFDLVQLNGTQIGTLNEFKTPYLPLKTCNEYPLKKLGTGDRFNDDEKDFILLTKTLDADIRDMECGAIVQTCTHADIPVYSFKAISDLAGSGSTTEQFLNNTAKCINNLTSELKNIMRSINENEKNTIIH